MELTQQVPRATRKRSPTPYLPGHPILGHLRRFRSDRIGMMLDLARSHPDLVELPMGPARRIVMMSSPTLANEVLLTKQASFVKAPGLAIFLKPVLGDGLLTSERGDHERQRKLLASSFAPKRIAGYAATMAERATRFAGELRDGESLDLAEGMMRLTLEIVGKTLFDAELAGDAAAVGEALTTAMECAMGQLSWFIPIPPSIPTPSNLRYRKAVSRLDEMVYRIVRARRGETGDRGDVLSTLLEARDDDGRSMTDEQLRDEAMTIVLAGHETTANALTWTFDLLARHPEVRAKLEAEVDALGRDVTPADTKSLPYALAVLKEAMRLCPPVYILGRRAVEDVAIGEHVIRRNTIVLINIIGIHRREDLFPEPDAFRPERFLGDREKQLPRCAYLPFGAGPRVCIGNHFATLEGHLLLATLARHVRFELSSDRPAEHEPLITLRPKGGLPVRVSRRTTPLAA